MTEQLTAIDIRGLTTSFGTHVVHQDLDLRIHKGEVVGIVGGSGSGKTTLLRAILSLQQVVSGSIKIFGQEVIGASTEEALALQRLFGVLFQQNALFSSLNLLENVSFPLQEHTQLRVEMIEQIALLKIMLAGLSVEDAYKYPSELSGGMQKRAGLARAIVLDPEIVFLDEPTAGLDPNTAGAFDDLILNLKKTMGLTIVIVTHDLDSLWKVTDRVAFLGDKKVLAVESMHDLCQNDNPIIRDFFSGPRSRAAQSGYDKGIERHGR